MVLRHRILAAGSRQGVIRIWKWDVPSNASHQPIIWDELFARRHYSDARQTSQTNVYRPQEVIISYRQLSELPAATCTFEDIELDNAEWVDKKVVLHGYLGTRRNASKRLTFAELHDVNQRRRIQLMSSGSQGSEETETETPHSMLQRLAQHIPVAVQGTVRPRKAPKSESQAERQSEMITTVEIQLDRIVPLNTFPEDLIMTDATVFPPEKRHLQIRNDRSIRDALVMRSRAAHVVRHELCGKNGFIEIETPLLFKSTPEGAREFVVPTRAPGLAYALPQSPQQYKQILIGSGISRYMQMAKCFRDEDLRADRQPEFTQVDLEMAFATGADVMDLIERLIRRLWANCLRIHDLPLEFPRLTYNEAMTSYGSDKPDMRFDSQLRAIDYMLPVDLVSKIGPLTNPIVEAMKFTISSDPNDTRKFVSTFMDSPEAQPFIQNQEGQPGIFIVDSRKPLQGLQPFGFQAAEELEEIFQLEDGDLVVIQARERVDFSGGSTPAGNLRLVLHKAAVRQGWIEAPKGFQFTWVTDFPLFTRTIESEPGQGGTAGLSSTHHPFTAPKSPADVERLLSDPLSVVADHYDLVVNGVELGGGSRRIHNAEMQELIMREVLQMSEARIRDFHHLLDVLRAGCPPHAGIALGFDRLVAVMLGKESVRDVIAFPKSGRGEDVLVGSPSRMTEEQLQTYHLQMRE